MKNHVCVESTHGNAMMHALAAAGYAPRPGHVLHATKMHGSNETCGVFNVEQHMAK
jgi:hypothetical protein